MTGDVSDVRNTMPTFAPNFWSRLTGKALSGQKPLYHGTWYTQLLYALAIFIGSIVGTSRCTCADPWFWVLIFPLWISTVHGARYLAVVLNHQAVHHQFTGNKLLDRVIGEIISLVTFTQVYPEYLNDHMAEHHGKKLATLDDPDLKFLVTLGFRFGASKAELWSHLYKTVASPGFHLKFLAARLKSNFMATYFVKNGKNMEQHAAWGRRAATVAFVASLLAAGWLFHAWAILFVAYVIPMTVFYNVSSLLQFICEHQWARVKGHGEDVKVHLARLTSGRFCGEPAPDPNLSGVEAFSAWARWSAHMAFIHAPARFYVLVGDLPVHDWHHRNGHCKDWPDAVYARQRDIEAGCPGWPEPPTEIWGLNNAIDRLFAFWSTLPGPEGPERTAPVFPPEVFVPLPPTNGILDKLYAEGMKRNV